MKIQTNVRAGKLAANHNQGLRVRTSVRAGRISSNHNPGPPRADFRPGRQDLREPQPGPPRAVCPEGGRFGLAHHTQALRVRSGLNAGRLAVNHAQVLRAA